MKRTLIITAGFCICGISAPSYAQSSDYENMVRGSSMQARIGVMVPFGGNYKKAQSKPQLSLGLRTKTSRSELHDWGLRPAAAPYDEKELKLALTMEATPRFLMNDQHLKFGDKPLASEGTLNGLDGYDKTVLTVIGVSLAVIAGSIIIISE